MPIHRHSIASYWEGAIEDFPARTRDILITLQTHGPMSDRSIMEALEFSDGNSVRPRITEGVRDGLFVEMGTVRCPVTGKQVRLVGIAANPKPAVQEEMAL